VVVDSQEPGLGVDTIRSSAMELCEEQNAAAPAPPQWLSQAEFDEELIVNIAPALTILQNRGMFTEISQEFSGSTSCNPTLEHVESSRSREVAGTESSGKEVTAEVGDAMNTDVGFQLPLTKCATLWRTHPALVVVHLHSHFSDAQLDRVARDYCTPPHHTAGMHAARILLLRQQQRQQQQQTQSASTPALATVPASTVLARNRRYRRLQQMLAEGSSYFSEAEIKERHPALHYELLGQLLGEPAPEMLPADHADDSVLLGTALAEANRTLADHPRPVGALPMPQPPPPLSRHPLEASAPSEESPGSLLMGDDSEDDRRELGHGNEGSSEEFRRATRRPSSAALESALHELVQAAGDLFLEGKDGAWVRYAEEIDNNDALDDTRAQERADLDAYFDY